MKPKPTVPLNQKAYLTTAEVEELLGVCRDTIHTLVARGILTPIKLNPHRRGAVRYSRADLDAALAKLRQIKPEPVA